MVDQKFLSELNILYVEDDEEVRDSLRLTMESVFNHLYIACDGQEAFDLYHKLVKEKTRVHAIVSDINMPNMNGITLLENIRKTNDQIPFIITTAFSEVDYLLKAIKLNATDYIFKPIDITELVDKIGKDCFYLRQTSTIKKQKKELERYLKAINNVAIISRTDLNGTITFVNQIFCDVTQYSQEELLGKAHSIIRHPDMPSKTFKDLWNTIKAGDSWQGKIKNKAKDGSAYYVNVSIIPLFDDDNENITEYIGIRFLTTDEEIEKREFKKKVVQSIQQTKKKQIEDLNQIRLLEQKLKNYAHVDLMQDALSSERKKSSQLTGQIKHYETEIKTIQNKSETIVSTANEKIQMASKIATQLRGTNLNLEQEVDTLYEEAKKNEQVINELNERVSAQTKVITDLRDVIAYREQQIDALK